MIVDLRGDEHRLVGAGGVACGLRLTQAALGARGDGRHCSLKRLVRIGTDLQRDPLTHSDVCNVLFRDDELRGDGVHLVHLGNQISLPDELTRQFLQLSRRRRDDPRDGADDGQESQLLLEVTPLGFEPFDLRLRLLDLLRTDAAQQGAQLALAL